MKKLSSKSQLSAVILPRTRLYALIIVVAVITLLYVGRLVNLQIASHDYYSELSRPKIIKTEALETTRGEIYDTNGVPLVTNEIHYNLRLNRSGLPSGNENAVIARLLQFFDRHGISYTDSMPVSATEPFYLTSTYSNNRALRVFVDKYKSGFDEDVDIYAGDNFYQYVYKRYKLSEFEGRHSPAQLRRIAGLRFELEVNDFSITNPYTLISDVDKSIMLTIADVLHDLPGVEITTTAERIYNQDSLAAQLIGRTDWIYAEEKDEYIEKGYRLDAKVGKTGVERAFEEHLRGINGKRVTEYASDGVTVINSTVSEAPKEGYSIRLTLDTEMQRVAENALERVIRKTAEEGKAKAEYSGEPNWGEDANAGSVVVLGVNDGSVLAMANYPSFNPNLYEDTKAELNTDPNSPLLNRATQGIFPPGSTFKPLTAAAALTKGIITTDTEISCDGVFTAYEDYQPACWLWNALKATHGPIKVDTALEVSCNYFFYQLGKDVGISYLDEYAKHFGLGLATGIEIGEATGILAGPESREERGFLWVPGDALQAAIGQSDHAFTPLQLATFVATLVNGGTRYKTHLLKSVHNYSTGEKVYEYTREVVDSAPLAQSHLESIKDGMKRVVDDAGTAAEVFTDYPYPIAGKTGTAQVGKGSETAVFIGFAPYENPQIAVAVVIEHGHAGNYASEVAKDIFTHYFES